MRLSHSPIIMVTNRLPRNVKSDFERNFMKIQRGLETDSVFAYILTNLNGAWVGCCNDDDNMSYLNDTFKSVSDHNFQTQQLTSSAHIQNVEIPAKILSSFYDGCCQTSIWPLFHSQPQNGVFTKGYFESYKEANKIYANEALKALRKINKRLDGEGFENVEPIIWIHDYHLLIASKTIRSIAENEGLRFKLSFFLHIPFPSWDILRLFPWADAILEGMLACDLVGFQADDYCTNFMDSCERILSGSLVDRSNFLIEYNGKNTTVKSLPIGIPTEDYSLLSSKTDKNWRSPHEENLKIILGVDRLDTSSGIPNKLRAYERLLEKYPHYIEKVIFIQVAIPFRIDTKEHKELKDEIDQLIGRINGRFSKVNWAPIRYIYSHVHLKILVAFYRDLAVGVVTPLRDGNNLVAKEFIACQNLQNPGVLLLSSFSGARSTMKEAVIVNPYEIEDVSDKILRCLEMSFDERALRMKLLQKREKTQDVSYWLNSFIQSIENLSFNSNNNNQRLICDLNNFYPNSIGLSNFNLKTINYTLI